MTKRQWRSVIGIVVTIVTALFLKWQTLHVVNEPTSSNSPLVQGEDIKSDLPPYEGGIKGSSVTSTIDLATASSTNAQVVEVVDGDTIKVLMDGETKTVTVRFLGMNTPETVDPRRPVECFGKEASHQAKQMMTDQRVRLEEDTQADNVDKYGRLLRNVFLADGTDVNAWMVEQGYAYAYVSFPQNKQRKAQMVRLQKEAQAAKRGLWSPDTCNGLK